jgi:hypothetical protein
MHMADVRSARAPEARAGVGPSFGAAAPSVLPFIAALLTSLRRRNLEARKY